MTLTIRPMERDIEELPKKQEILIDGRVIGDCRPCMYGHELKWHAVIKLETKGVSRGYLVQGHGASPHKAIANGILQARAEQESVAEQMKWLEGKLGTLGKTEEQFAQFGYA